VPAKAHWRTRQPTKCASSPEGRYGHAMGLPQAFLRG